MEELKEELCGYFVQYNDANGSDRLLSNYF